MEKKHIKIKELRIDDESGVDAIALVSHPAIEVDFMKFSKQSEKSVFASIDNEKRIITGPAMIPDKMIYRVDVNTREEYYVYFTKETVEKISQKYLIEQKQSNVNFEHWLAIDDISLIESWIIIDQDKDKSNALGFSVSKGTWMISMKVNNESVWNDLIKSGDVKGFSIEGYFIDKFSESVVAQTDIIDEAEKLFNEIQSLIESIDEAEEE